MESFHSQSIQPVSGKNDVTKMQSNISSILHVAPYITPQPLDVDILIGRGRKIQQHPGNISFLQKISECLDLYLTYERGKKHLVVALILEWLVNRRGHFVRLGSDGYWVEVTEQVAKEKIALAFRHRKIANQTKRESISAQLQSVGSAMGSLGEPGVAGSGECLSHQLDATGFTAGTATAAVNNSQPQPPAATGQLVVAAVPQQYRKLAPVHQNPQRPEISHSQIGLQSLNGSKPKASPLVEISSGGDMNMTLSRLAFVHSTSRANSSPLLSDEQILRAINEWENATADRGNLEARETDDTL